MDERGSRAPDSDDPDVPPQIRCARCGRTDCDGCGSLQPRALFLAWQQRPSWGGLWHTTLQTVRDSTWIESSATFDLGPAFAFACWAEALAVLSFGPLIAVAWSLLAATGLAPAPGQHGLLIACVGLPAGFALLLVVLHALYGVGMGFTVPFRTEPVRRVRQALCVALYTCGWDLLTSPCGFVLCLFRLGDAELMDSVRATRIPREALLRYATGVAGMPGAGAGRALLRAVLLPMLVLLATLVGLLVSGLLWLLGS